MLFAMETAHSSVDVVTRDFWREIPPPDVEGRAFADSLLREVISKREWLDGKITAASENWRIERMTPVDRSILRLGTLELLAHPEVPTEVVIDEAVELAKRYGADNSAKFVNGVLDRIASERRDSSTDGSRGNPSS